MCAVVLVLAAPVTGYVVFIVHAVEPDGPWDEQAVTDSGYASGFGLAFAAALRLTLLAPEL